jgi:hypothetical protein
VNGAENGVQDERCSFILPHKELKTSIDIAEVELSQIQGTKLIHNKFHFQQ